MNKLKKWINDFRLRKAIKKANKLHAETGYRYLVLLVKGKPRVYSKQTIKKLIKLRYFKKGVKISDIDRKALYTT